MKNVVSRKLLDVIKCRFHTTGVGFYYNVTKSYMSNFNCRMINIQALMATEGCESNGWCNYLRTQNCNINDIFDSLSHHP